MTDLQELIIEVMEIYSFLTVEQLTRLNITSSSKRSISNAIYPLIREGIIKARTYGKQGGGRLPSIYSLANPEKPLKRPLAGYTKLTTTIDAHIAFNISGSIGTFKPFFKTDNGYSLLKVGDSRYIVGVYSHIKGVVNKKDDVDIIYLLPDNKTASPKDLEITKTGEGVQILKIDDLPFSRVI